MQITNAQNLNNKSANMNKIFYSVVLFAFPSVMAFSSAIDGKWKGTYEAGNGPQDVTVVYKVDGEKVSGYFSSDQGKLEFDNGTITGNEFTYKFILQGYSVTHTCVLAGDKINVKWEAEGFSGEFSLEKSE